MNKQKLTFITSMVTLILVILVMCTFQLREKSAAVVTTMGNMKVLDKPGLYFRIPYPVQKVEKIDLRKNIIEIGERETITKDDRNLIVRTFVSWSVNDTKKFYERVGPVTEAGKQLRSLIESTQEAIVRKYPLKSYIGQNPDTSQAGSCSRASRLLLQAWQEAQRYLARQA